MEFNDNFVVKGPLSLDKKYLKDGWEPYANAAEVLTLNPYYRSPGLVFFVAGGEKWWFKDGIEDIHLVQDVAPVYTFSNGLTAVANAVKLGGPLVESSTITNNGFPLIVSGAMAGNYSLDVENTLAGGAIRATCDTGYGVYGVSVTGTGILGSCSGSGAGVTGFNSSTGNGVNGQASANYAGVFSRLSFDLTAVQPIVHIRRIASGGTPVNGLGASLDYTITTTTLAYLSHSLISKWTDTIGASRTSQFEIHGVNNAVLARRMAITGAGALIVDALAGSGIRMIVASATGELSAQTIPVGLVSDDPKFNLSGGTSALAAVTTSTQNTAVGYHALQSVTTGLAHTAFGANTSTSIVTGNYTVAIGAEALKLNIYDGAVAVGYQAGMAGGSVGTFIGYQAGKAVTTGQGITAIGFQAYKTQTNQSYNTCVGAFAMSNSVGSVENVAVGYRAIEHSTGSKNTAIGCQVLDSCTTGENNVAVGWRNLFDTSSGSHNVALGYGVALALTTGSYNICIGNSAGSGLTTGSDNILIGKSISASTGTTATLNIGQLIFGTVLDGSNVTPSSGNVGIGIKAALAKLHVAGTVICAAADHADNDAALLAGLTAGTIYRTGDNLKIVH